VQLIGEVKMVTTPKLLALQDDAKQAQQSLGGSKARNATTAPSTLLGKIA
jgi:hypothetical protein